MHDNKGALWRNEGKDTYAAERDTTKWPHFKGKCIVDGKEYEIACWNVPPQTVDGRSTKGRLDLRFNVPQPREVPQQQNVPQTQYQAPQQANDAPPPHTDEDLPF